MTVKEFEIQYALGSLSYITKIRLVLDFNTPEEMLTILSREACFRIRLGVADNPNTFKEILETLSKDKDAEVRNVARINLLRE